MAPVGVLAIVLVAAVASTAMADPSPDAVALQAFRSGLQDPDGALKSWDPELVDPCTWFHIICDDATRRVTTIVVQGLNLSGPLSPELAKLDQLKDMILFDNNFYGTIPEEFGDLSNLISLALDKNNISGHIPASLGKLTNLKYLRMGHNRLTGPIPRELTGLPQLELVDLSNNDLCGTIPGPFVSNPQTSFANNPRLRAGPGPWECGLCGRTGPIIFGGPEFWYRLI